VEIHQSETLEGVARMRKVDLLEIQPDQTVVLTRGGLHLMLMQPRIRPARGDRVAIELINDRGEVAIEFEAEVRPRPIAD
ncbi:MAG: copper chaperone PCu(A)C, partial [Pseudomonadota bacterium]